MSRRNWISNARSRRSLRTFKRSMQLEILERRQLFASDLTEVFGPQRFEVSGLPEPAAAPITSVSVATQATRSEASTELTLNFDSTQASRVDLSYPGLQADSSAFRFVYANAKVDLRSALGLSAKGPSPKFVLGEISNRSVFEALPEVDSDDQLEFRVSGKPGFSAASILEVLAVDELGREQTLRLNVEVKNEGDDDAEGEAVDQWSSADSSDSVFSSSLAGSGGSTTIDESLTISTSDGTATEPHNTFYQPTSPTDLGSFLLTIPSHWYYGTLYLKDIGNAVAGTDYNLSLGSVSPSSSGVTLQPGSGAETFQLTIPSGVTSIQLIVTPLADGYETESPEQATLSFDPDPQTVMGSPSNYRIIASGSATVTIVDATEGFNLSTENSTTKEFRTEAPYPAFIVKPDDSSVLMKGTSYLRIDASAYGSATPGVDYGLWLDPNNSATALTLTSLGSGIWITSDISLAGLSERRVYVKPIGDRELEQDESINVDLRTHAINGLADMSHGTGTAQLQDEYFDARPEKDEKAGCSCSCPTCSDGNKVSIDPLAGSGGIMTADGMVKLSTADQTGPNPVVFVGLTLPSSKVVPTSIDVLFQVIEKDADTQGNLRGLGRKLPANAQVSASVSLPVPTSAVAGSTLWFAMGVDVSRFLQSWTRGGTTPEGSTGITEQIIPLELLAHPVFPSTKPGGGALVTADKFSGWVGHINHAVRNQQESSIEPGWTPNSSLAGNERLLRNQSIMVPDVPVGGGNSGGKVAWQTGSMLFRADGGTSWFKDNSQSPPESQDTLSGDIITDGSNNKKRFNSAGDLVERIDATGNSTTYTYNTNGTVASIQDARGQLTSFQYGVDGSGNKTLQVSTENSSSNSALNRKYFMTWTPFTAVASGNLKVRYDDADGTGPRVAREDVYTYDTQGYLTQISTGPAGAPTHTTTITHRLGAGQSRRLASVTYPDGSSVTLDLPKLQNGTIQTDASGTIATGDPRSF